MTRVTVSSERMREICLECVRNATAVFLRDQSIYINEWRTRWFNRIWAKVFGAHSDKYVLECLLNEWCFEALHPSPIIRIANDILSALEDTSKSSIEIDARDLSHLKSWCKS